MTLRKSTIRIAVFAAAACTLAISAFVLAQSGAPASPPKPAPVDLNDPSFGEINFETKIGSFKLLNGAGRVQVNFTGSILISQLEGTVETSGDLKKEFEGHDKQVWNGKGSVVITGRFRAVQWFGTNMTGKWKGAGRARIYGEFDKDLELGYYWYTDDPTRRIPWSMYGMEIGVPEAVSGGSGTPVERPKGGSTGGG